MPDACVIAASLSDDERATLLALSGEGEHATIPMHAVRCLSERGLALVLPDGHINLSAVVWSVLDVLRAERPLCSSD